MFTLEFTDNDGVVNTVYSMSRPGRPVHPGIDCSDANASTPSQVRQAEAAACDINNIMKRYERDGIIDHVNRYQGQYGDVADAVDFHTAQNIVIKAQEAFMSLPAAIRERFSNDPGAFLDFATDPKNGDELREMGLANPLPPEAPPTKVEVVNPAVPEPKAGPA